MSANDKNSESFLFPEPLVLCELLLPAEVAFESLVALGNSPYPVHISGDGGTRSGPAIISGPAKHCRDLLMTLGSVRGHLAAYHDFIRMHCSTSDSPELETDSLATTLKPKMLYDLEASICSLHKDLTELARLETKMNAEYVRLVHLVNILDCLENVFWAETKSPQEAAWSTPASADREAAGILLRRASLSELDAASDSSDRSQPFIVGVVPTSKAHCLQLGVWRRFHLTAFYTDVAVRDQRDLRDKPVEPHNVFLIVSLSEEQSHTADRLCRMLGADVFTMPSSREQRSGLAAETKERLIEMRQVFLEGEEHRKRLALNGWTKWRRWFSQLTAMQSVYHALASFNQGFGKQYYIGEIWCTREAVESVHQALDVGSSKASGLRATVRLIENHRRKPPTRMPLHELTAAVRDLTYQFGVAAHNEIDPTPFTAVTFPFLFAIMFADWGHGLLLLALSLALFLPVGRVLHPDVARRLKPLRPSRHLLLMCAIFAIYCGVVLNEGFGLSVGWHSRSQFSLGNLTYGTQIKNKQITPNKDGYNMNWITDCVWGSAKNQMRFMNSARMKLSIIFGSLHLGLGLALQLVNDIRADRTARLWLFSVAKLIFHCLLTGYPIGLILRKWLVVRPSDAACAPALLPMLIAMYRLEYTDTPCYLATYYPGQRYVEHAIVACLAASALLIIFGLPIHRAIISRSMSHVLGDQDSSSQLTEDTNLESTLPLKQLSSSSNNSNRDSQPSQKKYLQPKSPSSSLYAQAGGTPIDHPEGKKHFELLEHFLACFEFLLSSLSHSASYLRLWAIGLAHGELTVLMWPMLLMPPTSLVELLAGSPTAALLLGGLALAASFCLWACITICILVGMEGMTALLHSLRLHWIEFQSKFYSGDGYLFRPFCLKLEVKQAMDNCVDLEATEELF